MRLSLALNDLDRHTTLMIRSARGGSDFENQPFGTSKVPGFEVWCHFRDCLFERMRLWPSVARWSDLGAAIGTIQTELFERDRRDPVPGPGPVLAAIGQLPNSIAREIRVLEYLKNPQMDRLPLRTILENALSEESLALKHGPLLNELRIYNSDNDAYAITLLLPALAGEIDNELCALVHRSPLHLLDNSETALGEHQFLELHVDWQQRRLCRHGHTLLFDGREISWKLFSELYNAAGQCIRREKLIELVWGNDPDFSENTLDKQIASLRKLLIPLGLTVSRGIKNVGYKLVESVAKR